MNAEENKLNHPPKTGTPKAEAHESTHSQEPTDAKPVMHINKEVKKETKPVTKPATDEAKEKVKEAKTKTPASSTNKPAKKKGKKDVWVKKEKAAKDPQAEKTKEALSKKWKPVFWGRFGKKNLRTRKNPKYDKWRKPRGEDMQQRKDDGAVVAAGYRTPKAIRGIHPSGYEEVFIQSARDLNNVKKTQVARFAGTIGRKKKIALIKIANEKKIRMLN